MLWMKIKHETVIKFVTFSAFLVMGESLCHAGYLIELNSGAKFVTSQYWQENDQVWFQQANGLVAVAKNQVKTIQKSEVQEPIRTKESTPNRNPGNTDQSIDRAPAAIPKQEGKDTQTVPGSASAPEFRKDAGIEGEFASLKQRVKIATDLETTVLYRLASDMTAFRNKVLTKNLGHIYSDQLLELNGMLDTIENIITSRNQ